MCVRRVQLAVILVGLAVAPAPRATASAFLLPAGTGEVLTTALYSTTTRAFDSHGHPMPVASYDKIELSSYIDYGLTDWLTVIAQPGLDRIHAGGPQPATFVGLGKSDIGAAVQLYHGDTVSVAFQALAETPSVAARGYVAPAFVGDRNWDGTFSLLVGDSFTVAGLSAFYDVEPGYRVRGAGWPDEVRLDVTLGVRPLPHLLLMLQSFAAYATAPGPLWPRDAWWKLQASAVYEFSTHWSVQVGVFGTVSGLNAGREFGPLAGLWFRF
jgi:hypothetical protein